MYDRRGIEMENNGAGRREGRKIVQEDFLFFRWFSLKTVKSTENSDKQS
jgi:hypothetical protein